MTQVLILNTGALGDVLRTTSILPGLKARYPGCLVTWVTAPGAVDLLRMNPLVDAIETLDPSSPGAAADLAARLSATRWTRVISLDDEPSVCSLATCLHTEQLKVLGTRSHPRILAETLAVRAGRPQLVLTPEACLFARRFAERHGVYRARPLIGLNTGAGGRSAWKQLSVERTVSLGRRVARALGGAVTMAVLGGPAEADRNRAIVRGLAAGRVRCVDAGGDNELLDFAALVGLCDLLVTSDSLALHVAVALDVRVVAFVARTAAAEIELYDLGEKVTEADTSTISAERLAASVLRQLALSEPVSSVAIPVAAGRGDHEHARP